MIDCWNCIFRKFGWLDRSFDDCDWTCRTMDGAGAGFLFCIHGKNEEEQRTALEAMGHNCKQWIPRKLVGMTKDQGTIAKTHWLNYIADKNQRLADELFALAVRLVFQREENRKLLEQKRNEIDEAVKETEKNAVPEPSV